MIYVESRCWKDTDTLQVFSSGIVSFKDCDESGSEPAAQTQPGTGPAGPVRNTLAGNYENCVEYRYFVRPSMTNRAFSPQCDAENDSLDIVTRGNMSNARNNRGFVATKVQNRTGMELLLKGKCIFWSLPCAETSQWWV